MFGSKKNKGNPDKDMKQDKIVDTAENATKKNFTNPDLAAESSEKGIIREVHEPINGNILTETTQPLETNPEDTSSSNNDADLNSHKTSDESQESLQAENKNKDSNQSSNISEKLAKFSNMYDNVSKKSLDPEDKYHQKIQVISRNKFAPLVILGVYSILLSFIFAIDIERKFLLNLIAFSFLLFSLVELLAMTEVHSFFSEYDLIARSSKKLFGNLYSYIHPLIFLLIGLLIAVNLLTTLLQIIGIIILLSSVMGVLISRNKRNHDFKAKKTDNIFSLELDFVYLLVCSVIIILIGLSLT